MVKAHGDTGCRVSYPIPGTRYLVRDTLSCAIPCIVGMHTHASHARAAIPRTCAAPVSPLYTRRSAQCMYRAGLLVRSGSSAGSHTGGAGYGAVLAAAQHFIRNKARPQTRKNIHVMAPAVSRLTRIRRRR